MINGHACKITDVEVITTGKHGHTKCHITGVDIFDGTSHDFFETAGVGLDVTLMSTSLILI